MHGTKTGLFTRWLGVLSPILSRTTTCRKQTQYRNRWSPLSTLNVVTSCSVGGMKVIGARQTESTATTGTVLHGAFDVRQLYTIGTMYVQFEVATIVGGYNMLFAI